MLLCKKKKQKQNKNQSFSEKWSRKGIKWIWSLSCQAEGELSGATGVTPTSLGSTSKRPRCISFGEDSNSDTWKPNDYVWIRSLERNYERK